MGFWVISGGLLGAIIGSFIAVVVSRWPAGEGALFGRSRCDSCRTALSARYLLPLISYGLLRGRCAHCGASIPRTHLAAELGGMLIGGTSFWLSPGLPGLAGAVFGWGLLALALLDLEHFWLPDRLTLPLAAAGLLVAASGIGPSLPSRTAGAILGFGAMVLIAAVYRQLRHREGLGEGDAKLLAAIGAWLGWQPLPFVVLAAGILGLTCVAVARLRRVLAGASTQLPLGALLAAAAWPIWLHLAADAGASSVFP